MPSAAVRLRKQVVPILARAPRGLLHAVLTQAVEQVQSGSGITKKQKALIVLGLALTWFLRRLSQMRARRGKHAPGPPFSIFSPLGHALLVLEKYPDLPEYYLELVKKYGRTVRLVVGPPLSPLDNIIIITHPDSVKHVLKDNFDNYPKGEDLIEYMHEVFGRSIFASNGDWWYHQRKTASMIFTGNNMMNEMVKIMINNNEALVAGLKAQSNNGALPVDCQRFFLSFTMDSFCEIGFGIKIGSLAAEMPPKWAKFVEYWDELQVRCPHRAFHPEWKLQKALAKLTRKGLPLGFLCRSEVEVAEMEEYVNKTIDEVIQVRLKDGAATKYSVLAGETASPGSKPAASPRSPGRGSPSRRNSSKGDENKRLDAVELFMNVEPPMSLLELREVVKGLILGGRDTTGVSIMWTFYELGCNPEIEKKLRDEVRALPMDSPPEFHDALKKAKCLDAVIRETIRLHSPVPIDAKKAANDDVLPDGTFVGKGYIVTYAPYVMARDQEFWGPDADKWRPERWFEGDLAVKEPSPFVYSMFQAGPRICLGKDLALLEAKACVALMLRAGVSMSLWPGEKEPHYKMGMILAVEDSMQMKVTFDN